MTWLIALVAGFVFQQAQTQTLAARDIDAAIREGQGKKPIELRVSGLTAWYRVTLESPYVRVANASADAARQFRAFTTADVTPEMTAPVLTVFAIPRPPNRINDAAPPVEHVVIRPKNARSPSDVLQPMEVQPIPTAWGNALGGKLEGAGLRASFDLATLPPGEFDVVVVMRRYNQECKVKTGTRKAGLF